LPEVEAKIALELEKQATALALEEAAGGTNDGKVETDVPAFELQYSELLHQVKDANGNPVGPPLKGSAIQVRCQFNGIARLQRLWDHADLDTRKFGYFVPYRTDSGECPEYADIVKEHLAYCNSNQVITVFGLHKTVLDAKIWCGKKMAQRKISDVLLDSTSNVKRPDGTTETLDIIQTIESSKNHDSDGKWHFVITKELEVEAKKLIDEVLIKKGMATIEFQRATFENNKNKKINRNGDRGAALFAAAVKRNKKTWMKTPRDFAIEANFHLRNRPRAKAYLPMSPEEFPPLLTAQTQASAEAPQRRTAQANSRTWTTIQVSPSPNQDALELATLDGSIDASTIATVVASVKELHSMVAEHKQEVQQLKDENKALMEEMTAKLESEASQRKNLEAQITDLKRENAENINKVLKLTKDSVDSIRQTFSTEMAKSNEENNSTLLGRMQEMITAVLANNSPPTRKRANQQRSPMTTATTPQRTTTLKHQTMVPQQLYYDKENAVNQHGPSAVEQPLNRHLNEAMGVLDSSMDDNGEPINEQANRGKGSWDDFDEEDYDDDEFEAQQQVQHEIHEAHFQDQHASYDTTLYDEEDASRLEHHQSQATERAFTSSLQRAAHQQQMQESPPKPSFLSSTIQGAVQMFSPSRQPQDDE
jgi:hypothetical protein